MFRDATIGLLERGLDAASVRHQALSNNVANVNTPGFKRADLDFARVLTMADTARQGLKTTNPGHIPTRGDAEGLTTALRRDSSSLRVDGNNVDIEQEMVHVAENSIYYAALSKQLTDKFSRLSAAISEGRR